MPCRALAPVIEEVATELEGKVIVATLNIDDNQVTAAQYGIRGIPTLLVFKEGKVVEQLIGSWPKKEIRDAIVRYILYPGVACS